MYVITTPLACCRVIIAFHQTIDEMLSEKFLLLVFRMLPQTHAFPEKRSAFTREDFFYFIFYIQQKEEDRFSLIHFECHDFI